MSDSDRWFDRMYERYQPQILSYCLRRVAAPDAADAAAEVFAVAWRRRKDMPAADDALPWLYGVARKVLSHQWRSARRRSNLVAKASGRPAPPPLTPEDIIVEREDSLNVRDALSRLKPMDREVLMLSAWEGLSHSEIAKVLDASLAAIDKRLTRAKRRLAAQYDLVTNSPTATAQNGGGR